MAKKSIAVIGLGKFGMSVAKELSQCGVEVLAIDCDEEKVQAISDYVSCAVAADACDQQSLKTLGIGEMDAVIVSITANLDASVMATIIAKELGVPFVFAKSQDEIHTKILEKVGADKVSIVERESGIRVARSLTSSGKILDFIELSDRIRLIEIPIKEEWVGNSLRELELRKRNRINVVAVRKEGELVLNLDPDIPLGSDTTLIVTVDRNDIEKLM